MYRLLFLLFLTSLGGCAFQAYDPLSLAPSSSTSQWKVLGEDQLLSSKYCKTVIPENFQKEELSLAELVDIALQNNPKTKSTWYEAKSKAAEYGQKLSDYFPSVDFTAFYSRQYGIPFFNEGYPKTPQDFLIAPLNDDLDFTSFYLTTVAPEVNVSYTIFDFGQRRASSESARQALHHANYNHNQQIQKILLTIMEDYYEYLYQRELLISLEENLTTAKATMEAAKSKFEAGVVSVGDVAQAKSSFLQLKVATSHQKRMVESSFAILLDDAGLPATMKCKVKGLPQKIDIQPMIESIESLVARAKDNRADFKAAQAKVEEKSEKYYGAKSAYRPVVDGNFQVGRNWYNKKLTEKLHYNVQLSLSFPLFKGFFYQNGVKSAKALWEKSTAEMLDRELSIIKDVSVAHACMQSAQESYSYTENYLSSSLLQYDVALQNYKIGAATILDLLSAQGALADARAKFVEAKRDWYQSLAQLSYATGTLCTPDPEKEPL